MRGPTSACPRRKPRARRTNAVGLSASVDLSEWVGVCGDARLGGAALPPRSAAVPVVHPRNRCGTLAGVRSRALACVPPMHSYRRVSTTIELTTHSPPRTTPPASPFRSPMPVPYDVPTPVPTTRPQAARSFSNPSTATARPPRTMRNGASRLRSVSRPPPIPSKRGCAVSRVVCDSLVVTGVVCVCVCVSSRQVIRRQRTLVCFK